MIAEAKFHDNFGAMDPKFGKQPAELGNFQELLDSPHVPDAHNSPSGGSTRSVDQNGSNHAPMAFQQNASGNGKCCPAGAVILEPSGSF